MVPRQRLSSYLSLMKQYGVFLGHRGRNANQSVADLAESALAKQNAFAEVLTKKAQKAQMELAHQQKHFGKDQKNFMAMGSRSVNEGIFETFVKQWSEKMRKSVSFFVRVKAMRSQHVGN